MTLEGNPYFSNNTYDTPPETRRHLVDRLFMNSRWFFVGGYVYEILRARSLALKGLYDREAWAESSHRVLKFIEGCGGRFHLNGLANIKQCSGPVVFISNHMSILETFVFPCIISPFLEVTFVVKESLVNHSLFGPVMKSRNPIIVSRKNPREDLQTVMTKGKELLSEGRSIIIFPQSTRTASFNPEDFNSLGIKLAKSAMAQVLPIAIKTDFWGNGTLLKDVGPIDRRKKIYMEFGEPFIVEGNGREEHQRVVDFVRHHLDLWKSKWSGME